MELGVFNEGIVDAEREEISMFFNIVIGGEKYLLGKRQTFYFCPACLCWRRRSEIQRLTESSIHAFERELYRILDTG